MGRAYLRLGRIAGVAVLLYSGYLLVVTVANLIGGADYYSPWVVTWILGSSIVGLGASLIFLLTIDGPTGFRTRGLRLLSWWLMFLSILLPTVISFFLAPLTATTVGLSFLRPENGGRHIKST